MIAAVAAITMLAAGCSSSSTPTTTPSANSKLSGAPIVVGSICSCTGPQAGGLALLEDTANAWASWTNAHAGINGHPVKMIVEDDGSDPATAMKAVKTLIGQDHVVAIVGDESLVDSTWAPYAQSAGVPVIGGLSFEAPFLTNPDFFATGPSEPVIVTGEFIEMQKLGLKHYGILYCAESPVCAQFGPLSQLASKLTGGTITAKAAAVSATSPNYTATCLAMKNAGVDGLAVGSNSTVVTRVVDACAKLGYKPKTINASPTLALDWLTDPNLDGAVLVSPNANYLDDSIPGVKDFLSAVTTYAPNARKSPQFSYDTIFPWVSGQLFAAAAKAGKLSSTSTPADVKKGLYALKGETLDGISQPLTFTPGHPALLPCYFGMQVKSGKLVTTDGGKPNCLSAAQLTGLGTALKALGG